MLEIKFGEAWFLVWCKMPAKFPLARSQIPTDYQNTFNLGPKALRCKSIEIITNG